ncbi:glycine-rich protein HC1-like [Papaver somniferum]|uniref:glycine-rich protein HC1-like n=1 Tax=Papaver somniferum TaxID=3469 RepID=UPI000E6FE06E|nr:glycine-rich protein HC1-like [Papaver somniferum]
MVDTQVKEGIIRKGGYQGGGGYPRNGGYQGEAGHNGGGYYGGGGYPRNGGYQGEAGHNGGGYYGGGGRNGGGYRNGGNVDDISNLGGGGIHGDDILVDVLACLDKISGFLSLDFNMEVVLDNGSYFAVKACQRRSELVKDQARERRA